MTTVNTFQQYLGKLTVNIFQAYFLKYLILSFIGTLSSSTAQYLPQNVIYTKSKGITHLIQYSQYLGIYHLLAEFISGARLSSSHLFWQILSSSTGSKFTLNCLKAHFCLLLAL